MKKKQVKPIFKKIWNFIWEEDSVWSWIVNIILAFVIIKFIVYPGLGFLLGTTYPIVAVMSGSMEHDGTFDEWWISKTARCEESNMCTQMEFYKEYALTKDQFIEFPFKNGFDTADIMVVKGAEPEQIEVGDVVVYWASEPIPVIHRVIKKWSDNDLILLRTKGDHNSNVNYNERTINADNVVGKAVLRIPYLGWIKIGFVRFLGYFGINAR